MGSIDKIEEKLTKKQKLSKEKSLKKGAGKKAKVEASTSSALIQLEMSDSSSSNELCAENSGVLGGDKSSKSKKQRRTSRNIVNAALSMAFDSSKVSDRNAPFVLTEPSRALGQDVGKMNINRSSILCKCTKHCAQIAEKLKAEFNADVPLVVHWDGKLIQDLTTKTHILVTPYHSLWFGCKAAADCCKCTKWNWTISSKWCCNCLKRIWLGRKSGWFVI